MNVIKKYCFFVSCFCVTAFFSSMLISVETADSTENVNEEKNAQVDLDSRLAGFIDLVKDLQNHGLLDGEILIARNGQILLSLQSKDIASSDTASSPHPQFMIGSVSKQFFAVALLKSLYESSSYETKELKIIDVRRKLHLPISQFLPEKSTIWDGNMPAWANEISLHHLLTHTSGIPNYTDVEESEYSNRIDLGKRWFESYHSTSEIIQLIRHKPLLFSPGSQHSYSNTGYVIIAEAIESITSLPVSQYIQEALFDRIGLFSTANSIQGKWDILKNDPKLSRLVMPFSYDPRGGQVDVYPFLHSEDISVAKGAGSIITTSADLLKWNQALHKDKSVLPEELYNLLITPSMCNYGYGIEIENNNAGVVLGHGGGIGAYRSVLLYMPEHDLSIVILSNICNDFDKIDDEFKKTAGNMKDTISDEKERNQAAFKLILEKYPNTRGFEKIAENIGKLFN